MLKTMHFYHDVLGFDNMGLVRSFHMGMVSAGGYHHHIGFNTWVGEGAPPAPSDALGMRYFTMVLPDKTELERVLDRVRQGGIATEQTQQGILVRDPSRNAIVLSSSGQSDGALS
jgi:catechol 2,3-dioxygenase